MRIDQVRFCPDAIQKYCWEKKGSDTVAVPMVHAGDKRLGTLQVCLRFDTMLQQPFKGFLAMIMRGKCSPAASREKRVSSSSNSHFWKCAWADREYCINHAETVLTKFVK